jgi:hypothetical protein
MPARPVTESIPSPGRHSAGIARHIGARSAADFVRADFVDSYSLKARIAGWSRPQSRFGLPVSALEPD